VSGLKLSGKANGQELKAKSLSPFISRSALQWFFSEEPDLACPFFVPREIVNDGSWPHPSRLPLGAGWTGSCRASGQGLPISDTHIREFCNLGYATACPHLPQERDWDAIRFSVARASRDQVTICFVCELGHAPIAHGKLAFDLTSDTWIDSHPDPRVLTLANCFLRTYRVRQSAVLI
jgi:hypothetical protein